MSLAYILSFLFLGLARLAATHSWVEQLSNIALNGSFLAGHGYPRGFVDKGMSDFDQEANKWLLPPAGQNPAFVDGMNLLCHPSQRAPSQSPGYPRLRATPGSTVAMRYAENGHVTLPGGGTNLLGKPEKGGTVFVFGTSQPHQQERLLDVLHWTRDGQGGNRRGRLVTSQNFDDGRCYQLGNGAALANLRKMRSPNLVAGQPGTEHELMCETDVRVPDDVPTGQSYTFYWVWQWPTAPGRDAGSVEGKDEYYVSCIDIDIVSSLPERHIDKTLVQQDPMRTAVADFRSRTALTVDPLAVSSMRALQIV